MGEIESDQLREKNRIKKIKSRENQQLNWSRQKKEGTKIKERNRKKLSKITSMTPDSHITSAVSTERVRKHREKLKVSQQKQRIFIICCDFRDVFLYGSYDVNMFLV